MGLRPLLSLALIVIFIATPLLASCQPQELDAKQILERTREAVEDIGSYREIVYYHETSASEDIRSIRIIECDDLNTTERIYIKNAQMDTFMLSTEKVSCDNLMYTRDLLADGTWRAGARDARGVMHPSRRLSQIVDSFLMSAEIDCLAAEQLQGTDVYRLHLVPMHSGFFQTDGEISSKDLWINKDTFYPVRLEMLVTYPYRQGREVKDISMINEYFAIVPHLIPSVLPGQRRPVVAVTVMRGLTAHSSRA
ncbi:MAG: hypothetical protein AB1384_00435 [Actinomycetota bacterium]